MKTILSKIQGAFLQWAQKAFDAERHAEEAYLAQAHDLVELEALQRRWERRHRPMLQGSF